MSRFWSAAVHGLTPYVPGEQPRVDGLVKLNTNENPYGPSPRALEAIRAATDDGLRRYPDPDAGALRRAIAELHGVARDQVFVGNGSDEVLAHVFLGLLRQERPLLFPDISYSFYPVYCGLYDIAFREVPLDDAFAIDPEGYQQPNGGIIFPNPNAPTGLLLPLEGVRRIAAGNPGSVVVVDEAYIDFGGTSAVALTHEHANLLVVQTLSKSRSLAGLRVGFAIGHPDLVAGLERVKNSFNSYPLDRLAIAGAVAALEDDAHFQATRAAVIASRERLAAALVVRGFEVLPSAANFLFVRHAGHAAADLAAGLRERRVLVRHFHKARIEPWLRITVGTDEECDALLAALDDLVDDGC